jgi:glycosyltransferase involved in cell wall biosynthesis
VTVPDAARALPVSSRFAAPTAARKRVLVILPWLNGGGAERVMLHLLNNLDRARYEPFVAVGAVVGAFVHDVAGDVPLIDLAAARSRHAVGPIVRLVRNLKPAVVLATCMNFAAAAARPFFPRGTRLILREGNSISAFLDEVATTSRLLAECYRHSYRHLYRMADVVVCQSEFMLEDMTRNLGVPRHKVVRIYNPVDVDKVAELANAEASPFRGEGPHVLAAGGLYRRKGFDLLLRAFARVRVAHPSATLTIIGEGEQRAALETLRDHLQLRDAVELVGFRANPFAFMKNADLFVSSSRYEGFANVIAEALACGTPVVATDCPSSNREVISDGVNGFLAPTEDAEGLAATMEIALHAPNMERQRIAEECRRRFAFDRIFPQYESLL